MNKKPFSIADRPHFENLIGLLIASGAMCPKCGYGTRRTSKNWRRCKRETCGERVQLVPATKEIVEGNAKVLKREFARVKQVTSG
jgi:hypothetical protein